MKIHKRKTLYWTRNIEYKKLVQTNNETIMSIIVKIVKMNCQWCFWGLPYKVIKNGATRDCKYQ